MSNPQYILDTKEKFVNWVAQDRESCGYKAKSTIKERFEDIFAPNFILHFQYQLRKVEYLTNCHSVAFRGFRLLLGRLRLRKLQVKLGFTIPINVFGPGLSIAHYGTIVVSQDASVGSNCRINVGVNIGASAGQKGAPKIGDNVYIGPGAILFGNIVIADGVSIGANATVNKSFDVKNALLVGTPARIVKECIPEWNS